MDDIAPYVLKLCNAKCSGYNTKVSDDVAMEMIKGGNALIIELGDYVDKEAEKQKLEAEVKKLQGEIKRCEGMLSNPNFTSKAPQAKVDLERKKLEDYKSKYEAAMEKLESMK